MNAILNSMVQRPALLTVLGVTLCLGLTACEKKPVAKTTEDVQSSAAITVEQPLGLQAKVEDVAVTVPECSGASCPKIDIQRLKSNYPQLDQAIEQYVLNYVKDLVQGFDIGHQAEKDQRNADKSKASASPIVEMSGQKTEQTGQSAPQNELQGYINKFIQLADEVKSVGSSAQLSLYLKPQVLDTTGEVATVVVNASNYVGGAHGSSAQQYFNFDLADKTLLNLDAIIQNGKRKDFNDLAYAAFEQWIKETQPETDIKTYQNLWKFTLSENFYLSQNGLILQYGEYEIGPYAVGLPRLVIPYDKLQGILKSQYLPQIPEQPKAASASAVTEVKK